MTELLYKWAKAEPERCGWNMADGYRVVLGGAWRRRHQGAEMSALVLFAVIEAIEARGWDCRLTSNQLREGDWHAVVWVGGRLPQFRQPRPSLDGFGPTPAAALLGAYLLALEAQEGTNP